MDLKFMLLLILGACLIYYGVFKLKAKDNLLPKVLVLLIGTIGELVVLSKLLFEDTIILPIILISGLIAMFTVITMIAWKERINPAKKMYSYVYFSVMGFLIVFAIVVFILAKTGFFG